MTEPIDLPIPPGIVKTLSPHAAGARYIDGDKVRFVNGKPQKAGGWEKFIPDQYEGITRGAVLFCDANGNQDQAFGTACKLYLIETADRLIDITPFFKSGQLTNPFSTEASSTNVLVNHVNHGINNVGDVVHFANASAVGGITIDGEYTVTTIVDVNNYRITHSTAATSTAGPGGGTVDYNYEIPKGLVDGAMYTGFGVGRYGEETYGTPRTGASVDVEPRIWSMDEYGASMMCCYNDSVIYRLDWPSMFRAEPLANAPITRSMFVTSERYVMALGCVPDGETEVNNMHVRWADQTDPTIWVPAVGNTANGRTLQDGKRLMGGVRLSNFLNLVWSDTALYGFRFTGSSVIYDSPVLGENCGLVGQLAFAVVDSAAFWMTRSGFRMFTGIVQPIPNEEDVREFVYDNLNYVQIQKVVVGYISKFREIIFMFPTEPSDEPDIYVAVNIDEWHWTYGTGHRTTVVDFRTEANSIIMFGDDSYVYHHEQEGIVDDDGAAMESFLQTGIMKVANGRYNLDIMGFIPDFETQVGDVSLQVTGKMHPRSPSANDDTQSVTIADTGEIDDLRVEARHVFIKLTSNVIGGDYRMGTHQLEWQRGGYRR